jgi:sulfoxide reductase heme-binding subunit YedZ
VRTSDADDARRPAGAPHRDTVMASHLPPTHLGQMTALSPRRLLKPTVFLACSIPFSLLLFAGLTDALGADPIEEITHRTGFWGLTLLLITLAVTPVRRVTGWNQVIRVRRMLGLFAFFYVTLHFLTYIVLDQFFGFSYIIEDIAERPYITVGFTSFLLLIPLAVTSTKGMIRRLGKRWQKLHRLVYVAAIGGVLHFLWLVKADIRLPAIYGTVLLALFVARLWPRRR